MYNIKMAVLVLYIWCFLFAEKSKRWLYLYISSGFGQKGRHDLLRNYIYWLFSSMGEVHCVTLDSSELTMSDQVGLELTEIASVIRTLFLRIWSVMEADRVKYAVFQVLIWFWCLSPVFLCLLYHLSQLFFYVSFPATHKELGESCMQQIFLSKL